jgi:hypothetical protein
MTTQQYCSKLLDEVEAAGRDPRTAYLVRTRLRRALVALERGRSDQPGTGLLEDAPRELQQLTRDLAVRVVSLCQPSESLDLRWKRDWQGVLTDVSRLQSWLAKESDSDYDAKSRVVA